MRMDELEVKSYQLYGLVTNKNRTVGFYGPVRSKGQMGREGKYRRNEQIGISYKAYISTFQNKQSIN